MKTIIFLLFLMKFTNLAFADSLDRELSEYISEFNYKPVERLKDFKPELIRLGSKLFGDLRLSLSGDKSCFACHLSILGSGDNLPLALGVGTLYAGMPSGIFQNTASVTKRHTRPLYNKGHKEFNSLFTDGRVHKTTQGWKTPDEGFNNNEVSYQDIVKTIDSTLAVQALFPMVDLIEMRGEENQTLTNLEVWEKITFTLVNDPNLKRYFKEAFGNNKINIGHIANAIAHFEKYFFQVTETKWDKYLRG